MEHETKEEKKKERERKKETLTEESFLNLKGNYQKKKKQKQMH